MGQVLAASNLVIVVADLLLELCLRHCFNRVDWLLGTASDHLLLRTGPVLDKVLAEWHVPIGGRKPIEHDVKL